MGWMNKFRALGETERANPWDETVINGAPYVPPEAIGSSAEIPAAAIPQNTQVAEPIKSERGR
jgi:hypothetical protein